MALRQYAVNPTDTVHPIHDSCIACAVHAINPAGGEFTHIKVWPLPSCGPISPKLLAA